jgi:hypothetical protein
LKKGTIDRKSIRGQLLMGNALWYFFVAENVQAVNLNHSPHITFNNS